MNNFSGISFKVSPDLKRFIPGQINSKKAPKKIVRENLEKEEEENKIRSRSDSFSDKNISQSSNSNLNIKNVTNVKMNESCINNQTVNNHILNIKNMERELDRLMEKLIINLRERKSQANPAPCVNSTNFGMNFDNVFKTNTSQIIKIKAVVINSEEKKNPLTLELPINERKENFIKDENKFIGRKRSLDSEISKEDVDSDLSTGPPPRNIYKSQKIEESNSNFSLQGQTISSENLSKKNPPVKKNYSLFDKFFLLFKKSCYYRHHLNVSISSDKKEFTFSYKRKNSDEVHFKIIYDHELQKILLLEKTINSNIVVRIDENSKLEFISNELTMMLEDITNNVEKKENL